MMLRFFGSRRAARPRGQDAAASPAWNWQARIPAMIFAYGAAIFAVLLAERLVHSVTSANYAALAVVPGGLAAGICAFALSFTPRARLFVLAAVVIVALLPLGVIALSIDFHEYRVVFEQRAPLVAGMLAAAIALATALLIAGGVFPASEERR